MTKKELARKVAETTGNTNVLTTAIVDAVFDHMFDALASGEKVSIYNFGNFELVDVPEREVKSPASGEMIIVPAHKRVKFSPGTNLKEAAK